MAQSLSKIYLHVVFHIKTNCSEIRDEDLGRVHAYIGKLINETGCNAIRVGGIGDHIHALCELSRTENPAHLIEEMKRNSSRWIKSLDNYYNHFSWQGGYAVFSVSQSMIDKTLAYINKQKEHHRTKSFKEEYLDFLKMYNIEFNEQYVFAD